MKLLAISDTYIPREYMHQGLVSLEAYGVEVEVRHWEHASLIELQQANLAIEQGGPDAVELPAALVHGIDTFEMLVVQFAPVGRRMLEAAQALRVLSVIRGGTENVAMDVATARGVCVLNTPGRNARAVAEGTLGLMLAEIRNLARSFPSPALPAALRGVGTRYVIVHRRGYGPFQWERLQKGMPEALASGALREVAVLGSETVYEIADPSSPGRIEAPRDDGP